MMRTYRGVVCEKKTKYMVFLTAKGEFLRGVPIGDPPEIGEEAEFALVTPSFMTGRRPKTRLAGAFLVAAALLFFFVSSLSPLNDKVMAYVQLESGTAMEFGMNRKGNVISLRYLNEAQKGDLAEWKNRPILSVLDRAISELSMHDNQIIVTTVYPTAEKEHEARQVIGAAVQEVRGKYDDLNLQFAESTPEKRKVANKKKMSIHQFNSVENEKSSSGNQPDSKKDQKEKKSEQKLEDKSPKTKKDSKPSSTPQQNDMEKKGTNQPEAQQSPPVEKKEKKQNDHRSENVPPHADKKGPPDHSSSLNKQPNDHQGPPVKQQQKENPSKNPQNNK